MQVFYIVPTNQNERSKQHDKIITCNIRHCRLHKGTFEAYAKIIYYLIPFAGFTACRGCFLCLFACSLCTAFDRGCHELNFDVLRDFHNIDVKRYHRIKIDLAQQSKHIYHACYRCLWSAMQFDLPNTENPHRNHITHSEFFNSRAGYF